MRPELLLALSKSVKEKAEKEARGLVGPGVYPVDATVRLVGDLVVEPDADPVPTRSKARAWDLLAETYPGLAAEMEAALSATTENVSKRGAVRAILSVAEVSLSETAIRRLAS